MINQKASPVKSKLSDSIRKNIIRNKKNRVKSPGKKNKIKVNVPKAQVSEMKIEDAFNYSVIDENTMAERLLSPDKFPHCSRSYMSAHKHYETVNPETPESSHSKSKV